MQKKLRLTAALYIAALAMISGCSTPQAPADKTENPQADALEASDKKTEKIANAQLTKVNNIPGIADPNNPEPTINGEIEQYIKNLTEKGFSSQTQGVWMQAGNTLLANYRGTIPLPAASVTKVATSLAALQTFGPEHRFVTTIGATGSIENGVLKGDLIVQGGEDPLFVWEEAIALGNTLNQMGIQKVTGNLLVAGKFYMNFKTSPQVSGNFLKQALDSKNWPQQVEKQYLTLPPSTAKPQITIDGKVKTISVIPSNVKTLVRHNSFPLAELLKRMNRYSNNYMADMIANSVGGAKIVAQKAAQTAGVPQNEIKLVNGSGLSVDNRISPRAATAMFLAIERYLAAYQMSIGDVFAIVGKDEGTLDKRNLPSLVIVKSGTLNNVSSLAGTFPTQQQGNVWFAIMNVGENTDELRLQQESLLSSFLQKWGEVTSLPAEFIPNPLIQTKTSGSEIVN
ncbi:MAG TPA: D-alanyl-D-alanine carboxypeptidase [Leptolyngbyaceae cyanobacterium]